MWSIKKFVTSLAWWRRGTVMQGEAEMKTLRMGPGWLMLALACGAGCALEEPRGAGVEHFAGDAADPAPEVHTGNIATARGPMEIRYELIDGHAVFEGDIVIPAGDLLDPNVAHAATVTRDKRWPGNVVPYVIDPSLPDQGRVTAAIAHWQQNTDMRFVSRTTQADYVRFVVSTGCASNIGRIGGEQRVWLGANCTTGNTIHEIGHAVGLWHEQSRQDRDNHVVIHWENIQPDQSYNFNKYSSGMDVGGYDIGSIMHYGSYAFSMNGQRTITTIAGGDIEGQRIALSFSDRLGVAILYATPATGDDMRPGEMLAPGQGIMSSNGMYWFVYQPDGNLVLYRLSDGAPLWNSGTWGTAASTCLMQTDGNLVVYRQDGVAVWNSGTGSQPGNALVVQNNGNVVIFNTNGVPVWTTNTSQ